jgi:hypothetical protein
MTIAIIITAWLICGYTGVAILTKLFKEEPPLFGGIALSIAGVAALLLAVAIYLSNCKIRFNPWSWVLKKGE